MKGDGIELQRRRQSQPQECKQYLPVHIRHPHNRKNPFNKSAN